MWPKKERPRNSTRPAIPRLTSHSFLILLRSGVRRVKLPGADVLLRSILRGALTLGMQGLEKADQRRHLGRGKILPIRRHVSAALQHLVHELVIGEPRGHTVQRRAALAS